VDEQRAWERIEDEPERWFRRFDFARLHDCRSILAAFNAWMADKTREVPRSLARNSPKSWRRAAEQWRWVDRWNAWDNYLADEAERKVEAERVRVLSSGYAQRYERVKALDELADLLLDELKDPEKRWLDDIKGIGSGRDGTFREVVIERFNSAIIEQFRGTLADIADEMGDRTKKVDQNNSGEIKVIVEYADGPAGASPPPSGASQGESGT